MNKIKVLDNGMINKIAAGEVVERPLSVVKELLENSIDAGATDVTVEIKDGGISLIRVTDNGRGIPGDQVRTAFLRHATSKISTLSDLENIMSLGFRGEALSSIAEVSQVELITKTMDEKAGTRVEIHGGEIVSEGEVGAADGTSIQVRNLFYNVPARRKFLKKPATESGYIADMINKLALCNPGLAVKYINNQTTLLHTKGNGDLKTTIFQIYGKDAANGLLELDHNKSGVRITGYLGKPELGRGNRNYSLTFINGRYIKSDIIQAAVDEVFKTRLTVGRFPFFVLHMQIAPDTVDVNVHPTKLEVRFSDEGLIYNSVLEAATAALKAGVLIPSVTLGAKPRLQPEPDTKAEPKCFKTLEAVFAMPNINMDTDSPRGLTFSESEPEQPEKPVTISDLVYKAQTVPQQQPAPFFSDYKIIGQIFNTYWIIEQDRSVYLIDQHAAHERVLYEKLVSSLKSGSVASQRLVQPIIIPVSESERLSIEDSMPLFEGFGFELEAFDKSSYALYAVPFVLKAPASAEFFTKLLDGLSRIDENIESIYDAKLDVIAGVSCKAAVKANDRLTAAEARALIEQVLKLENPFSCPHGRPTIIELSRYELERKFKRIQ